MSDFIESKEFVEHLDAWLFKSNPKDSNWIYLHRNKIPEYFRKNPKYLYKGLFGVPELFNFKTGFVKLHGAVSFSESQSVAIQFLNDSSFKFNDRTDNKIKILIRKKFPSVVFDIYKYFLFYGEDKLLKMGFDEMNIDSMKKEKEILVYDVKIKSTDFTIIK